MIQISTTAPASWPGANTPLTGPARPVAVVTPVAPVGPVASARADEEAGRRIPGDAGTDAAAASPSDGSVATTVADTQAKAEQQKADQEALEAREQADREAIERLRQALVDAWDASAAVVEQALAEKDPTASGGGSRAAALYDAAALDPAAGQTGQIISRRV